MKVLRYLIVSVIIGLIIGFFITFGVGFDEVLKTLGNANYLYLFLAVVAQFCSIAMIAKRWMAVIKKTEIKISFWKLFLITLTGSAFSNITPSLRYGGEPVRAYFLNKMAGTHTKHSLATVTAERLFDAFMFAIVSLIAIILAFFVFALPAWIIACLIIAFIIVTSVSFVIFYISLNHRAGMRLVGWFLKKFNWLIKRFRKGESFNRKAMKDVEMYSSNMRSFLRMKNLWAETLFYSFFVWFFDVLRILLIFMALGYDVSLLVIFSVLVISSLFGAIPLLPGGLALMESSMIIVYASMGINLVLAGVVTIIDRLISFWLLTFIGLFIAYYLGIVKGGKKDGRIRGKQSSNKRIKGRKARRH